MPTNSVAVRIADREYRIRSDVDEAWLQRVAHYVDDSLRGIRERTDTVDSLDVAILTALNLAKELMELRESGPGSADVSPASGGVRVEQAQLLELIDFVESELRSPESVLQQSD